MTLGSKHDTLLQKAGIQEEAVVTQTGAHPGVGPAHSTRCDAFPSLFVVALHTNPYSIHPDLFARKYRNLSPE